MAKGFIKIGLSMVNYFLGPRIYRILIVYHEDLEQRDGVWCGGARETREPHVTTGALKASRFSRS